MKKFLKILKYISIYVSIIVVIFSSAISIYIERDRLQDWVNLQSSKYFPSSGGPSNTLEKSSRQVPPDNIEDLIINEDAHQKGQWSAPIDWNVTAIHSVLLPDSNVLTFGTFGIEEKENIDVRENKKLILTDGREVQRDFGEKQWHHHDVDSGVDFDIWNVDKGYDESAHVLFKKPVLMDAFCSVVRVIDSERVFILGGNENEMEGMPDTQTGTMIYNLKDQSFKKSKSLNFKRWYGSIVRTGENKLVMIGGISVTDEVHSQISEIIDLENIGDGWKVLDKTESYDLFANKDADEFSYPKAYLSSDGNIVGISYNKIWVMDRFDGYRVSKTGKIPLVKGGISNMLENNSPSAHNTHASSEHDNKLKLMTIGSPVGSTSSSVMIERDQVLVFGGKQNGHEYSPSNRVVRIDFSDSNAPKLEELGNMRHPRSDGNATILPTGEVFLNGGHAYDDLNFSILQAEIYNPKNSTSTELSSANFRRNYHASSLLLSDGTILTAGGDVWNAEIFYPPYLFTKNWDNKTVLAKRPKILELDKNINRGNLIINTDSSENIDRVTLISTGSTTHAQGSESKFVTLKFSKLSQNQLSVEIPKNRNEIQDGTYLIFLINNSEVPSHGKIININ